MAESVDALVSNTSGFTSIPVRPRVWVHEGEGFQDFLLFYFCFFESIKTAFTAFTHIQVTDYHRFYVKLGCFHQVSKVSHWMCYLSPCLFYASRLKINMPLCNGVKLVNLGECAQGSQVDIDIQ